MAKEINVAVSLEFRSAKARVARFHDTNNGEVESRITAPQFVLKTSNGKNE